MGSWKSYVAYAVATIGVIVSLAAVWYWGNEKGLEKCEDLRGDFEGQQIELGVRIEQLRLSNLDLLDRYIGLRSQCSEVSPVEPSQEDRPDGEVDVAEGSPAPLLPTGVENITLLRVDDEGRVDVLLTAPGRPGETVKDLRAGVPITYEGHRILLIEAKGQNAKFYVVRLRP